MNRITSFALAGLVSFGGGATALAAKSGGDGSTPKLQRSGALGSKAMGKVVAGFSLSKVCAEVVSDAMPKESTVLKSALGVLKLGKLRACLKKQTDDYVIDAYLAIKGLIAKPGAAAFEKVDRFLPYREKAKEAERLKLLRAQEGMTMHGSAGLTSRIGRGAQNTFAFQPSVNLPKEEHVLACGRAIGEGLKSGKVKANDPSVLGFARWLGMNVSTDLTQAIGKCKL